MPLTSSLERFYNCTVPWFGPLCQYSFGVNDVFSNIVQQTYITQNIDCCKRENTMKSACYILLKCDRGPYPVCLDWREVCDGKTDCIDGGEDEKHCFELETNQCTDNEYRCFNGMCVDEAFVLDNTKYSFRACPDGTDEIDSRYTSIYSGTESFDGEDIICRSSLEFSCGDGRCIPWPTVRSQGCRTARDLIYTFGIFRDSQETTAFARCWKLNECTLHYDYEQCKTLCETVEDCKIHLHSDCRDPLFFPDFPVWDNHVRSVYLFNETISTLENFHLRLICYNYDQCPFLHPTIHIHNYTCRYIHELVLGNSKNFLIAFLSCIRSSQRTNEIQCQNLSMLKCPGTNKCISKHRMMDGMPDCYSGFDESSLVNSCEMNDKHRFRCTSENKCLWFFLIEDDIRQCVGGEDDKEPMQTAWTIQDLPFSGLCDGWTDFDFSQNDTDETNCERWQCVNQYTRCNQAWNCPKGIDEINCPASSHCPPDHHPCISPINYTMSCLHVDHADNGIVDCLGATDERAYCRRQYPSSTTKRYRCWNDTTCVNVGFRCSRCGEVDASEQMCLDSEDSIEDILRYLESCWDDWFLYKAPFSLELSDDISTTRALSSHGKHERHQRTLVQGDSQDLIDTPRAWSCRRGILVYVGKEKTEQCFCSSIYYGDRCQYHNQRVSLTLRLRKRNVKNQDIFGLVITLVDHTGIIHSYDQHTYIPASDCDTKFQSYLLYQDRPKDMTKNYTVRVDAYRKVNLTYIATWILPINFLFMPVNRVSAQLTIPDEEEKMISHDCNSWCSRNNRTIVTNTRIPNCWCDYERSTTILTVQRECNCSPGSICIGVTNNRSICLCPLTKGGPRCFLKSVCSLDYCQNGGLCIPPDERASNHEYNSNLNATCICLDGFSGNMCENMDVKIEISFMHMPIPQSLLVHFITLREWDPEEDNPIPLRSTTFKKIPLDQNTVTFFTSQPFNLLFAETDNLFYLTILQLEYISSTVILTKITPAQRCPHIHELFDPITVAYPVLRRVKYYHVPCRERPDLACFHDNETFMCLCTKERHANCFHFDFNITYDCSSWNHCENGARCFQNRPLCPTKKMCVCTECFYGTECQFTTKGPSMSLDAILGYHIHSRLGITRQSVAVKVSITLVTLMLALGLINGILSAMTLRTEQLRKVSCCFYLFASSITSILLVIMLNVKVWLLIHSQMSIINSRSILEFNCKSIVFILRSLLAMIDWFNACVAVERAVTIICGINFDTKKSKRAAKWVIIAIPLFVVTSIIQDPIHRHLIDDKGEGRTWCLVRYPPAIHTFDMIINILHIITPFFLNFISPIVIIMIAARKRSVVKKQQTYKQHLKEQFRRHKSLIFSPIVFVLLAVPRLIISFLSGCMKSARNPWLFLFSYFVPFVPSLLTFIVFIWPSETYKTEFKTTINRQRKKIRRLFNLD